MLVKKPENIDEVVRDYRAVLEEYIDPADIQGVGYSVDESGKPRIEVRLKDVSDTALSELAERFSHSTGTYSVNIERYSNSTFLAEHRS